MYITYKIRPYELTYFGRLIEQQTKLIEHTDFEFGACNQDETTIHFLRDMTGDELDSIQVLIDTPILDDTDIKQIILNNKIKKQNGKFQAIVQSVDPNGIVNVVYSTDDIFDEKEKKKMDCILQCRTTVQGLQQNDTVIVEYIEDSFVITGKIF